MSFLQNASIRTKILSLILPLCIIGLGATVYMSARYKNADTLYSEFIAGDNAALVELSRANRNLQAVAYRCLSGNGIRHLHSADFAIAKQASIMTDKGELIWRD